MPELPEVETTRLGLLPHAHNQMVTRVLIRQHNLRWPVPRHLKITLKNQRILAITRRAKYLLWHFDQGTLLVHLGMSGRIHALASMPRAQKHDHIDIMLENNTCLRYHDPRRFGAFLWTDDDPNNHPRLSHLGVEPLIGDHGDYLYEKSRGRRCPIKSFIMDQKIIVGVGNIYANEALFAARIRPTQPASALSRTQYKKLAAVIKHILTQAIEQGGTTLRDFSQADGKPGYFAQALCVYQQTRCSNCQNDLTIIQQSGRSSFYCARCQD